MTTRVIVSWSGGKDCAWALHRARSDAAIEIVGLFTTYDAVADRVGMHGTPRALVEAQARALGLPMTLVGLPRGASNAQYETAVGVALARWREAGVGGVVAGDLHLADVRAYREALLGRCGLTGLYPLWGTEARALAAEMLDGGLRARVVAVDSARLDAGFCGRELDADFLAELPAGVDPCGENGEYHTFVTDAPGFAAPVRVAAGPAEARDGMVQCALRLLGDLEAA